MEDYLQRGLYIIFRKCPMVHHSLGYDSIWDITALQFKWLIENLAEEFKEPKDSKKKK